MIGLNVKIPKGVILKCKYLSLISRFLPFIYEITNATTYVRADMLFSESEMLNKLVCHTSLESPLRATKDWEF